MNKNNVSLEFLETSDLNINNYNYKQYWNQEQEQQSNEEELNSQYSYNMPINTEAKKAVSSTHKISYEDILSSLNMVSLNGKLHIIPKNGIVEENKEEYKEQSKKVQFKSSPEINNQDKNSYIYNKYFKDYNQEQDQFQNIRVPKTKEEYIKMLLEDRIKRHNEKIRIAQIKPKTLLFSRENTAHLNIGISQPTQLNKLFNFNR